MFLIPISRMADSPAERMSSWTSREALSISSSIRAGWMRPSWTRRSRDRRAISRRMGSKLLRVTASGVSSMIRSTPVRVSKARMLRPSLPMMRPFMSSVGRGTTLTDASPACSTAQRCMAETTISPALRSASLWAFSSRSFRRSPMRYCASSSVLRSRISWACSRVRQAISSSFAFCCRMSASSSVLRCSRASCLFRSSSSLWETLSSFRSRFSSFCSILRSARWSSLRRSLMSRSASWRSRRISSLASVMRSFLVLSAASCASSSMAIVRFLYPVRRVLSQALSTR